MAIGLSLSVITINIYLVTLKVSDIVNSDTFEIKATIIAIIVILGVFYVIFCLYLLIYLAIGMGATWPKKVKVCLTNITF